MFVPLVFACIFARFRCLYCAFADVQTISAALMFPGLGLFFTLSPDIE